MLHVCVGSTDRDLTTTGTLKLLLNTTSTANDAYYSAVIRQASKWAETYIGSVLTAQSYSESVAGYGRTSLLLKRTPLRAVARLFETTDTGTGTEVLTSEFRVDDDESGVLTRSEGFSWQPAFEGHSFDAAVPLSITPLSGQEERNYLVDYVAGWTYGGIDTGSDNWSTAKGTTSTGRSLPEDVEAAVAYRALEMVQGGEVNSESLSDLSVNYRSLGNDKDGQLTTRAREMLNPYRRFN